MRHDWIAILSVLALAGVPAVVSGCSSQGDGAVSSSQGLRGGDRDADVDEAADEAARGDGGRRHGGFDRDKDSDELADEAATGDRDKDSDELADEADGGRRHHECRDGGAWDGSRDAGENSGAPFSPSGFGGRR
jgi:hypothetical protein